MEGNDASKAVALISENVPEQAVRVSVYKNFFARQNRLPSDAKTVSDPPKFLAIMEFNKEFDITALKSVTAGAQAKEFKLLKAFGEKVAFYD